MAASQKHIDLINRRLEDLQQVSQALNDALSSYVDHVTSVGRMWIENQGMSGSSYRDISNALNNSVDLIMDMADNLKGDAEIDRTNLAQMTAASTSEETPTSSSSSSPSSSNLARPASSLPDQLLLKLQDRLETVEKEMTHMVEMKEEMDGLKEGINKVKEETGDFREEISALHSDIKKVKKTKGKIENIQKKMEEYEESRTEMEETISEIRTDHDELSGQVKQLSDNYEETKVKNHGWLRKFDDRMYKHEQSSLSLTSDLEAKIDGLDQRVATAETRIGELEKEKKREKAKLEVLDEKMNQIDKDHDKLELILERVDELEGDMRDVQRVKLEEIEERIRSLEEEMADQGKQNIMEDRLTAVEEDKRVEKKSVNDIKTELTRCVSRVDAIDKRRQLQVAVHARLPHLLATRLKLDTVVTNFTDVITNKGGFYDPSTGVFTAPVDGVYITSLVHRQWGKDWVWLTLYHAVANPGPGGVREEKVCETWTDVQKTCCTGVGVVWMCPGDRLYVKVRLAGGGGDILIAWPSSFFCSLIN